MASKTLRELTIKLDADVAELKKGLAKANKSLTGFQKKMKGLGQSFKNLLPVIAIGAAVMKVGELVGEMSTLGKELEGVKAGFASIDPKVLDDMRKATHGTVTDLELMKQAVQFKNFGLPVKQLGSMLEFVHRRARTSGQSVKFLADSLVTGLGRKSVLIIDNLGISASQLNAELKKTPDFTEAVAAIMKRDMQASGAYIETAADITERWAAQWQNTKAQVGLFMNKGIKLIAPIIDDLKKSMGEWLSKTAKDLFDLTNRIIIFYNKTALFRGLIAAISASFKLMRTLWTRSIQIMSDTLLNLGKILGFVFNPLNWGKGFGEKLKTLVKDGFAEVKNEVNEAGNEIKSTWDNMLISMNSRVKMLVWDDETTQHIVKQAADAGKEAGKEFSKGIKKGMLKGMVQTQGAAERGPRGENTGMMADKGISAADQKLADEKAKVEKEAAELKARIENLGADINNSLKNMMVQGITALAENLGKSIAGTGNMLDGMLNMLLEFGKSFGKMLIANAIAAIALKNLMKNPWFAIPAGIALIALSTAAQSAIAKKHSNSFAMGGIVPGSSFSGDNVPVNVNSGELILNRAQQGSIAGQLGRGGGRLSVVVSGSDLKFILDEANRMDNNSF